MKYIIILGIQNSGSGAIHDYLASREDCESPFGVNEFKLCLDPVGLHNLFLNFYENFSFLSSSNARYDFLNYTSKLQDHFVYVSRGVKKKLYNQDFHKLSEEFVNKVTKVKYLGRPEFSNFKITKLEKYYLKLIKKYNTFFPIIIPEKREKFIFEARKYINKVIENNVNKKLNKKSKIILNQSVNIFNPINSSIYFKNRKIIYVTRDPRDMYSSMKFNKSGASPWKDVNIFIQWYKHYFDNPNFKQKLNNKHILHVKFKDFVLNFQKENLRICKFLGINSKFKFKKDKTIFDLSVSRKNLTKYINYLPKSEEGKIRKELKKFLQRQ
tara:strand:+ start:14129 stop:15106 length:978 start_codon:yes stop_codon:yes gene_type:complete